MILAGYELEAARDTGPRRPVNQSKPFAPSSVYLPLSLYFFVERNARGDSSPCRVDSGRSRKLLGACARRRLRRARGMGMGYFAALVLFSCLAEDVSGVPDLNDFGGAQLCLGPSALAPEGVGWQGGARSQTQRHHSLASTPGPCLDCKFL